jgi:transcriptional regulator with XRE-family HTH domain
MTPLIRDVCYGACMHSRWDEAPDFGELLSAIITSTGLSQREIAELAGVSHSQISRWKAGAHQPGYAAMMRLGTELRYAYPSLGDLTPSLVKLAGYPAPGAEKGLPESDRDILRRLRDHAAGSPPAAAGNGGKA